MNRIAMFLGKSALIVEDDALIAMTLQDDLEDLGITVTDVVATADEAADVLSRRAPDVILLDLRLAGVDRGARDGVHVARMATTVRPDAVVVFVTGSVEPAAVARMREVQPAAILNKPVAPDVLRETLMSVLKPGDPEPVE